MLSSFSTPHNRRSLCSVSLRLYICTLRVAYLVKRPMRILSFCLFVTRSFFVLLSKGWFISNLDCRHPLLILQSFKCSCFQQFLIMFLPTTKTKRTPVTSTFKSVLVRLSPYFRKPVRHLIACYILMFGDPGQDNVILLAQFYLALLSFFCNSKSRFRSGFSKRRYGCSIIRADIYVPFFYFIGDMEFYAPQDNQFNSA